MNKSDEKKSAPVNEFEITQEHLDEAIKFLEKAKGKGIFEQAYIPYLNLGQAYVMKGHLNQAIQELEQAIKLAPHNEKIPQLLENIKRSLN